jgi:hypothetical protein
VADAGRVQQVRSRPALAEGVGGLISAHSAKDRQPQPTQAVKRSRMRSILAMRSSIASVQHREARRQNSWVGGVSSGRSPSTSPIRARGIPTLWDARMNATRRRVVRW